MKYIIPIEPKPQSRPRFRPNGKPYELKGMLHWKQAVALCLRGKRPKMIASGSVMISMTFYLYPPQTVSKAKSKRPLENRELEKIFVDKRPDLDNYVKAFLDASDKILFKDDGQIAAMTAQKLYSLNPRIEIVIERMSDA